MDGDFTYHKLEICATNHKKASEGKKPNEVKGVVHSRGRSAILVNINIIVIVLVSSEFLNLTIVTL